jgi:hypothetical protein
MGGVEGVERPLKERERGEIGEGKEGKGKNGRGRKIKILYGDHFVCTASGLLRINVKSINQ